MALYGDVDTWPPRRGQQPRRERDVVEQEECMCDYEGNVRSGCTHER